MVRAKKETAAKAEAVIEVVPATEESEETKKSAGRGKRKGKDAVAESSPPKRTLRSNSKTTLTEVGPVEKEVAAEEKKGRKAPTKSKKAPIAELNGNGASDAATTGETPTPEANETELTSKTDNVEAASANGDAPVEKEKTGKGRKKNEKTAVNKTEAKDSADKEADDKDVAEDSAAEKEKSKPVKVANGAAKGKKKGEKEKTEVEVKEPDTTAPDSKEESEKLNGNNEEAHKEKAAKGKKKAEKPKEEEVAPKKTKKEAAVKPTKAAKTAEVEEDKEKEPKADTKKAKGKTVKAKEVKEVAIEHWVKSIFSPFCNPSVVFSFNAKKTPRRGSFEIVVIKDNDEEEVIWSGLKLGPPRKEKFPSDQLLKKLAETLL